MICDSKNLKNTDSIDHRVYGELNALKPYYT